MDPDTPAAAVQWGTRPNQCTLRATLSTLADLNPQPPATIVIGEVAAAELAWYENRPLFGRRIVVTRAQPQAAELAAELRRRGAEAIEIPAIAFEPPDDLDRLARAAADVGRYHWVVFTSPTGVARFFEHLRDARSLGGVRVAAIGPGTATALAERNVVADLIPEQYVAESLLEALSDVTGPDGPGRVLIPRAETARDVLPDGLATAGWDVDVVPAYRTVAPAPLTLTRQSCSPTPRLLPSRRRPLWPTSWTPMVPTLPPMWWPPSAPSPLPLPATRGWR